MREIKSKFASLCEIRSNLVKLPLIVFNFDKLWEKSSKFYKLLKFKNEIFAKL